MDQAFAQTGVLAEIVPLQTTLGDTTWTVLVASDLLDAARGADGEVRPRLQHALQNAMAGADASRFRIAFDSGDALWSGVVERGFRRVRLGSPGFHHERATATLVETMRFAEQRAEGDRVQAWLEHAATWNLVGPEHTPLDIDRVIAAHDLLAEGDDEALASITERVRALANEVAPHVRAHQPPLLERLSQWGLGLQADHPVLRVHALALVAALPSLDHDKSGRHVARHVEEMLRRTLADHRRAVDAGASQLTLPGWLVTALSLGATLVGILPSSWIAGLTRAAVRKVAGIFIAGEDVQRARPTLDALGASGRAATLDRLGEAVVTEEEADNYRDAVLELVEGAAAMHRGARNGADLPLAHVSIKCSALAAHFDPTDPDGTWLRVGPRLTAILRRARELGVFIQLDAEHYAVRNLTFAMLQRALREDPALWAHPDVGIVVQAYLKDAPAHVDALLAFCRERGVRMPIRLVKGAYWDAETTEAAAHRDMAPQWLNKVETDRCYQLLVLRCLRAHDAVQLALGSHNLRDHCFARAARELLAPDAPPIEHQCLHATWSGLSLGMARAGWPVRNYIPVGSLLMGMAYLVRRVMENSSQVGVLTMARQTLDLDRLLQPPEQVIAQLRRDDALQREPLLLGDRDGLAFAQTAPSRVEQPANAEALEEAIAQQPALTWLQPASDDARNGRALASTSPEAPERTLGQLNTATAEDVDVAVSAADEAQPAWQAFGATRRALLLMRAGERMRARRNSLAALCALEAGKARAEALADVDEAVDFCQFYAREALRLEGETSRSARGVIAVVAPWNFPLAIPCGMTAAALAAGNAALLKGAEQTPLCAEAVVRILREVGVPAEVCVHLAGDGPSTGAALVQHASVDGLVFTGSAAVGTRLFAQMQSGPDRKGRGARMAITEMGGKNAVVVAASADLDEAVLGCLRAAFGHAGQKCSAASRIIVDPAIADAFAARFAAAAADLRIGAGTARGVDINPVISEEDATRLRKSAGRAIAEAESAGGRCLLDGRVQPEGSGHLVAPTVVLLPAAAAMAADSQAQIEHFGPIVHIIPADRDAMRIQAATRYALTAGIYTQLDADIDDFVATVRAGNAYVNRPITGARVAIEPFGGFAASGTGPKAGGGDYLAAMLAPSEATAPSDEAVATAISARRAARTPTLAIAGQRTWDQHTTPRNGLAVVATGSKVTPRLRAHLAAAAAMGDGDVLLFGPPALVADPALRSARHLGTAAAIGAQLEALAACAVVVTDGADAAALLATAFAAAPDAFFARQITSLPAIVGHDLGADAIAALHLPPTTVAVSTLRHGAPMVLELPDS